MFWWVVLGLAGGYWYFKVRKPSGYSAQLGGVPQGTEYVIDANMPDFNKVEFDNAYRNADDPATLLQFATMYEAEGFPIAATLMRDKAARVQAGG